jgi:hypothetical protein
MSERVDVQRLREQNKRLRDLLEKIQAHLDETKNIDQYENLRTLDDR